MLIDRGEPRSQVVPYEPVPCKSCGAILNPYSRCDFAAKLWICPFCHARNHFPAHYQARLPLETHDQCRLVHGLAANLMCQSAPQLACLFTAQRTQVPGFC